MNFNPRWQLLPNEFNFRFDIFTEGNGICIGYLRDPDYDSGLPIYESISSSLSVCSIGDVSYFRNQNAASVRIFSYRKIC